MPKLQRLTKIESQLKVTIKQVTKDLNMKTKSNFAQLDSKWKFLFLIPILYLSINLVSCHSKTENKDNSTAENPKPTETFKIEKDSLEKVVKSIIDISTNDFYKNQRPLPTEFRNVQIKYHLKPSKEMLYILCGQFQTEDNAQWTQFITIKNYDYEQWVGPNGLTYCENSTEISYSKKDLSIELKNKLNSLKVTTK